MFYGLSIGLISLIVFGNIENLILASQGVVKAANPLKLAIFSLIVVLAWLIIGTVCTQQLEAYGIYIEFIGGFAIFVLGIQSMIEAVKG
ncbi:hypothetical protein [Methanobrevibacter sp.]|uniref:hypothetical protein n=1 Tax=Methanobrevibacter sp. TaxID=66852 RepID=UPI0025DEC0AE|nr:hypothetical protein [Methanobrevibacter sp.]MBQ2961785.1 hypothetical protein [Methanobrevibacter sp.]